MPNHAISRWQAPVHGQVKFNCNASWKKDFGGGYIGIILRNHKGELLNGRKAKVVGQSALICEALALIREACLMAKALGLRSAQIESDNKQLISLSVSELVPPCDCDCIIQDIRELVLELDLHVIWIPRKVNGAAHWVASFASGSLPQNWVSIIPAELSAILLSDC